MYIYIYIYTYVCVYIYIYIYIYDKQTQTVLVLFKGPADCNHHNCNHMLFSEFRKRRTILAHSLKQLVVAVAVVTVCWSYELQGPRRNARV